MPTKKEEMNLNDLLITKVSALYDVENNLIKALPKMAEAATDPDLIAGFEEHLEETKNQVGRLEEIFALLDADPEKIKVEAIRGLIADGEWVIKNVHGDEARDANLIRVAQYIEHYEIAGYRGAIAWAKTLGKDDVADLLEETLEEEVMADEKLDEAGEIIDQTVV